MVETRTTYRVNETNAPERTMPNDIEAEQAVLGALLMDSDALIKVVPIIEPSDFYLEKHRWVYEAMAHLRAEHAAVDFLTVCSELERRGKLDDCGGAAYLSALQNAVPTVLNVETYAVLVYKAAVRRSVIRASTDMAGAAYDGKLGPEELITHAGATLAKVRSGRRSRFETTYSVGLRVEEEQKAIFDNPGELRGLATGFKLLDKVLGGLRADDLTIIAGRPGSGKTALADQIALNVALTGKRVAYFTLEMSSDENVRRLVNIYGEYDSTELDYGKRKDGERWRDWTDDEQVTYFGKVAQVEVLPILWNAAGGISTEEATAAATELLATQGVDLVIFDYLGLAKARGDGRYEQVGAISRGLKEMNRVLGKPVIAMAQLNRECEKRADKRPQLADLRDSGDIEQDADTVIFIYRPKMYWKNEAEWSAVFRNQSYPDNLVDFDIAKHRKGKIGFVQYVWKGEYTKFFDVEKTPTPERAPNWSAGGGR